MYYYYIINELSTTRIQKPCILSNYINDCYTVLEIEGWHTLLADWYCSVLCIFTLGSTKWIGVRLFPKRLNATEEINLCL